MFLGIDGGGTKTAFTLIDGEGRVLARHVDSGVYHPEIGLDGVSAVLQRGVKATLQAVSVSVDELAFSFVGLPCHGEDSHLQPQLDALPGAALPAGCYRCGNDMVCGWAGSLGAADGINIVAGTGSIAYGEWQGRSARAGGWGELFSDEGSAYWIAREGLALFSRMSDGRCSRCGASTSACATTSTCAPSCTARRRLAAVAWPASRRWSRRRPRRATRRRARSSSRPQRNWPTSWRPPPAGWRCRRMWHCRCRTPAACSQATGSCWHRFEHCWPSVGRGPTWWPRAFRRRSVRRCRRRAWRAGRCRPMRWRGWVRQALDGTCGAGLSPGHELR
jgi:hypothetical protein